MVFEVQWCGVGKITKGRDGKKYSKVFDVTFLHGCTVQLSNA